jgi:hypothetical protein
MISGHSFTNQASQLAHRHQTSVDRRFIKKKFTPTEDTALLQLVETLGPTDWNKIALHMGTRNARQCRERYQNYLDPSLQQGGWTWEEDALLAEQFREHGSKWHTIARAFTKRSDLALRNRWQMLEWRSAQRKATPPAPPENAVSIPVPVGTIEAEVRPASPFGFPELFDFEMNAMDDPFDSWTFCY